ncbi:lytic polysaccharide monooxygenase auxiliary activity family 9 protein [Amycolatopsis sp. CA-230715]|uniref:lytic polysaccharide monooxygenase auxiliary activity family 9 protein n=1 Tax=Amycolatopsis sp. CA-230715 TaxID=2745196 RepID=UPI001C02D37F|nr:lytic polysaccharide monooxygenase [Amycolatopsis sp. CA-230715]QWF84855.1 Chitin-binding protein CbpD [Amycolatopsis sp. CA-230715]
MRIARSAAKVAAMTFALCAATAFTAVPAFAHGSMGKPVSRIYQCFQEGPEEPQSAACKAAVAVGDSWPLYDWDEVNIGDADGHSRDIIPDGKLCSAGRDKYKGLDLPRADWPATTMPSSGPYTFQYQLTAAHEGTFELYVTKNGYDPTQPLKWSDLEATPFYKQDNPPIVGNNYQLKATLPGGHSGRHLIYSIWQRHWPDSGEAFYSCSDVLFR